LEVETGGDLASGLAERVVDLLAVELADDVERRVGHGCSFDPRERPGHWWSVRFSCGGPARFFSAGRLRYSLVLLRRGQPGVACEAGCPSGQWERTVNPSRKLR